MSSEKNIIKYWKDFGANVDDLFEHKDADDAQKIEFFGDLSEGERFYLLHSWQIKHALEHDLLKARISKLKYLVVIGLLILASLLLFH